MIKLGLITNYANDVCRTDASSFVSLSVILSNMKLDFLGLWIFIPQAFEAIAFWSGAAYKSWILKRVYFSKIVQFKFWQDSILNSDWWNSFDSHQQLSLSSLKEMQNLSLVSELSDIKSLFDELVVVTSQTSEGKSKLGR